jgi:hypothetical protein
MRHWLFLLSLGCVVSAADSVVAVDYGEVPRPLLQEPDYRADSPEYALLLFGPRADLRVWMVLDRDAVYLDRNGDGDLTQDGERFASSDDCRNVTIKSPDGARYVISSVSRIETEIDDQPELLLLVHVEIPGPPAYRQYCGVVLQDSAAATHLAHFGGPLSVLPGSDNGEPGPEHVLRVGEAVELDVIFGTVDEASGCWTVVEVERGGKAAFPEGVFPSVDIEFPARGGGAPIRQTFPLSQFC